MGVERVLRTVGVPGEAEFISDGKRPTSDVCSDGRLGLKWPAAAASAA